MTDRSERGRVMYMTPAGLKRVENGPDDLLGNEVCFYLKGYDDAPHAVYVAPLREGEPVPGDTWLYGDSEVVILTSPFGESGRVGVRWLSGRESSVSRDRLRPPPRRRSGTGSARTWQWTGSRSRPNPPKPPARPSA